MKKRISFSYLVSWFVLLAGGSALTAGDACGQQQQTFISVKDSKSNEPVSFAHVCFEGLVNKTPDYQLTSIEGTVPNSVREASRIVISYVGYVTYNDTIRPGESRVIYLKPSILNMQEVVVTGQYTPEKSDKSIYKIQTIGRNQIDARAATNLAGLLSSETSLKVESNGVLGTSLRMQGLSGENIKILQDGIPMIGRMNGDFDLTQLNLNNVDHVEVLEGPMSVIYGSNALAGVINIITRENRSTSLNVYANTYYETIGQYNFDLSATRNFDKNSISLSGGRNFFEGYSYSDTSRQQQFKPRRQYFFDGYYGYSAKNLKVKLTGDYFNELLIDKGPLEPAYFETAHDFYFTTIRYSGRGDFSMNLPRNNFLSGVASYSAYERMKQTYYVDLTTLSKNEMTTGDASDTTGIHSVVGRIVWSRSDTSKKFNYQTGIDINIEDGTGKRITGNRQVIGDYAAFISLKWDPWKIVSLQPGVRLIYNTRYNAPLVYALSARIEPFEHSAIRMTYARGFRAPDIKQLYLTFKDVNHDVRGNPDLNAETSQNVNLSFNYTAERRSMAYILDLTGFFNNIDDVILLARVVGTEQTYQYINLSRYQTTGFQAGLTYSLYPSLRIQAGVAGTGIRGSYSGEIDGGFIFYTDYTLSGSYRFAKPDLTLALFYKYSGKTPEITIDEGAVTYRWVNPFNSMDFTATKGFWSNRIKLSGGVKNIFDVTSVPAVGASGEPHSGSGNSSNISWGRTYFLGLSFNFNKFK